MQTEIKIIFHTLRKLKISIKCRINQNRDTKMQRWSTRKYCIRDADEICTTRFKNRFDKCRNEFFVLKYAQFYLKIPTFTILHLHGQIYF